jgi:hypothetical protein
MSSNQQLTEEQLRVNELFQKVRQGLISPKLFSKLAKGYKIFMGGKKCTSKYSFLDFSAMRAKNGVGRPPHKQRAMHKKQNEQMNEMWNRK